MKKERLIEYAAMLAVYIATTGLTPHPEVQAYQPPLEETHPVTVMPENLPQRYRELRFLNHQPEQVATEAVIPVVQSRLASVGNMDIQPVAILPETTKIIPQRSPITYEEAQEFVNEVIRITGKIITPEDVENSLQKFSIRVQCAVKTETLSLNPYAIGAEFELGPGQLHRSGKLSTFYKEGYTNPFDPDEVFPFMEKQFAFGDATHWAGPRDGLC
jgi:hypothetical protein